MGSSGDDDDQAGAAPTSVRRRLLDPDDQALLGRKLGDYRVDAVLGEGGMGIVFKGEQLLIKKTVAIKVLKRGLSADASFASRLLDEARAVNTIHHPAIIDAFGFGQAPDGRPYIVMEFLQGEPLDARLAERGALRPQEALLLLQQILAPLEAAHAAGVIHRDLKPSNVFLQRLSDGTDFPKLLDFGLARFIDSQGRGSGIVGTPTYMAPEQARDGEITPAADLYAVGCIAYELLVGRPPFEAPSVWGLIEKHLTLTPPPLSQLSMTVDDDLSDFVMELLAKDPKKRPTATQARREVARLLRAREEASTLNEGFAGRSGPTPKPVDPQEAQTVMGIEGVDVPLPAPKGPRPRRPSVAAPVRDTAVSEQPEGEQTEGPEEVAESPRPAWFWPVLGLAIAVAGLAAALLLRG